RLDQAVQQEHVDATYAIAVAAGKAMTSTPARLGALAGACATDTDATNDDMCLDAFIRRFGERALRMAVTDDDVTFYRGPAGAAPFDAADYADVTALLMTAPQALYLVEHGDTSDSSDFTDLGAYELASRLSYHFWQTMPDEELLDAARSGALLTEEGYAAQVNRVFEDPRAREAVAELFSNWLDNTTLEELDSRSGTPVFDAFAGDFTPGPDLREHMLAEVVDSATWYAFDGAGSFDDFFASDRSFARTEDLAAIYGVSVWDGASDPPAFQDDAHAGLITRAAYVATGSANTRPIMKGVFLRKALLCDDIAPPPPNAAANPPMLSETATTRQVVEQLTANQPCAGCHKLQINPLGFATENFDALGRVRTAQAVFDETTGAPSGSLPIDTTSVPHIDTGDDTPSTGARDVSRLMLESPKPHACFARQYFRFTFGRTEDLDTDGCVLADVKTSLDEGAPLAESLRAVAMSPAFRKRSFKETQQ
ncbi:MAG TPA: DUF1592 domain-containing protein, partial [Polyangiaceae bacterium]|nr:DUF1592 domain-containing protein [Polyangiaceae bacterium]